MAACRPPPNGEETGIALAGVASSHLIRRFIIHDQDARLTVAFDEISCTDGTRAILAPFQVPRADAYAERFRYYVRLAAIALAAAITCD